MHGIESTPVGKLIENLRKAGLAPVLGADRHIVEATGLPFRRYKTKPVYGWGGSATQITGWKEEDWAPLWAVVLIDFHRNVCIVGTPAGGHTLLPEMGYKEVIDLMRRYVESEDAAYAALAAASLCGDPVVAKLAQEAIRLPLHGVRGVELHGPRGVADDLLGTTR